MPKEATMPVPEPWEEDEEEKDEEGEDGEEGEDEEAESEESGNEAAAAAPAEGQKEQPKEADQEKKAAPTPEQKESTLLEKADGLILRLEEVIGKLKGSKLAEGKKLLAEARGAKKELKIKLAKLRKGGEEADVSAAVREAEAVEQRAAKLTAEFKVGEKVTWKNDEGKEMRGEIFGLDAAEGMVIVKTEKNPKGFAISKSKLDKMAPDAAEKSAAEFELGEMVAWKNDKGQAMHGEIIGLGEVEGVVIVKTEKNPKGFAISKNKLEKTAVSPDRAAALIGAANDFDSLIAAVEQVGALRGSKGNIYTKAELVDVVTLIRDNPDVRINSPLVASITNAGGLRAKLIELMRPREFAGLREDYTKKNALLTKNFSGITGWMSRLINRGGYKEAMAAREDAYNKYAEGRAELVLENVDKMITEEIALADSQAAAFQAEKGWGSKLYDRYKKLGKVRMIISLGLVGGGFLLAGGAPAFVMAGTMGVQRLLGGTGAAVGSYDIMNKLAEKNKPKFDLTPEQQAELDKFENEKGVQWYKREIKFFGKPSEKGQAWQRDRQALDAKRAEFEKIQAQQKAPEMSDKALQKAIAYFEAVTAWNGKKPSEDSTYMILMAEKARRYKKALQAEKSPEANPADKRPFEEQVVARRKEKTAEAMVTVIDSLKQRHLVSEKLFVQMAAVKGTPEQRKKSPEYAAWVAGKQKLAEIDAKLPPDMQVFLQNYGEGRKHPSLDMLVPKQANDMKSLKPDQIKEEDVWAAEWQLRPELQAELNELLDKNALLNKEAEDEVREAMTRTVEDAEAQQEQVEKTKAAVLGLLDEEMRKQDAAVEKRRRLAVYADAAMKAAAAAIGVVIASGVIQQWLRSQFSQFFSHTHVVESGTAPKVEPVKPTVAPVEPVEPVKPTVEPVEPVKPTVEPVEPVKPTVEPVEPVKPTVAPEGPKPGLHDVVKPWKPNILTLQKLLEDAGHSPGGLDGHMGKLTRGAIESFQAEHGLPVTGQPSKALMAALKTAAAERAAEAAAAVADVAPPVEAAPTLTPEHADFTRLDANGNPYDAGDMDIKVDATGHEYTPDNEKIGFQEAAVDSAGEPGGGKVVPETVYSSGMEDNVIFSDGTKMVIDSKEDAIAAFMKMGVTSESLQDIANTPVIGGKMMDVATNGGVIKVPTSEYFRLAANSMLAEGGGGGVLEGGAAAVEPVPPNVEPVTGSTTSMEDATAGSAEPHADVQGEGSVVEKIEGGVKTTNVNSYFEGTVSGVGQQELVESGILKEDWLEHVRKGVTESLTREGIVQQGRHIYAMQQALENAQAAGDTGAAEAIARNIKTSVRLAEKRFGDVFQL